MEKFFEGLECLKKGEKDKAIPMFEEASKEGDYRASYHLGSLYSQGLVVAKDLTAASEYFDEAFKQLNDAEDSNEKNFLLATFYLYGLGTVAKDEFKAVEFLNRGAKNNDPTCMMHLANCLRLGLGTDKDEERAYELISKLKDFPPAYKSYADFLLNGCGVKADPEKAKKYYEMAEKAGDVMATFILGTLYFEGKGVKKDDKKSREYFEKAARFNHPEALKNLAYFSAQGIAGEKDATKEAEYLKRYADTGSAEGMYLYGTVCVDNARRLFRYLEGIDYLKKATQLKEPRATHLVGKIYERGLYGTFKNEKVAFNHYVVAYNLGDKSAAYDVLRCLKMHIGVEGNTEKQVEEFEKIVQELEANQNNKA